MAKKKLKINHDVKNNFEHYSSLVRDRKTTQFGTLYLKAKPTNVDWEIAKTSTVHKTLSDTISFYVESKINNKQDFKFGLISKDFTEPPFFRFDSDGAAHHNRDEDLGIEMILTPHFQKYSKNGLSIAYQTEQLKNKTTCETLIKDINFCMAHFCHESNTRYLEDEFPEVDINYGKLDLIFSDEEDPLKGLFINNG
jgi:hypothetical protein